MTPGAEAAGAGATPAAAALRPLTLRAKAILAIAAIALFAVASGGVLSWQRAQLSEILEEMETLNQVSSTLARVNAFASQAALKINEGSFAGEPRQVVESVQLDMESIAAGLGALGGWYPKAGEMRRRLDAAIAEARRVPARGGVADLRAAVHELAADLDQLARELRARHERMWSGYRSTYDSVTLTATILFVLGLAVFGGVVMVFFRRLAWDLQALSQRAVEVVRGYRGEPLRVTRRDEVGALIDSVNRMQHILREREQQIEVARQQRFHQEKMVAIGSLAAAVAHEINNPIAAIEGVAQFIGNVRATDCCPNGGGPCQPELILEHTRRISGITRQLSDLTAAQSTEPEWTDLNALVRATTTFVTYDPRFRAVKVDLALDPSIPAVWAVGDHLTQILMNLLINAADALVAATPPERRIRVATAAAGGAVSLAVRDNAGGMADEVAARAFEEGFTTKPNGSGIGLFICKTLAELGGGNIRLDTRVGEGTEVAVMLPRDPAPTLSSANQTPAP